MSGYGTLSIMHNQADPRYDVGNVLAINVAAALVQYTRTTLPAESTECQPRAY